MSGGLVRGAVSVLAAGALWEIAGRTFLNNPLFFAPLSAVLDKMGELWASGDLQVDIAVSFEEFIIGFILASIAGIGIGVVMASSKALCQYIDPWVSMLYATPFVAVAPLLVLWLGIGLAAHVAVVFIVVVFPVLINTYSGLANSDRDLIEVARSFGADQIQIFSKIRFPGALPFIVAGLRQGVARGLVGVVVAELFGSHAGLGYLILISGQEFDAAGLFVGILLFALAGIGVVEIVRVIERRIAPWRAQDGRS
ncbi:MAG TPA: ABC transporter permease [Stellaceae bacterium]|nr:ABC transporter permease [Stellaceae bacterium]